VSTDFRLQADFLSHHKVRRLRARLGPDGVLAWLGLIGFAAANKADGRLAGLNSEDIALVAGWNGEQDFTGTLIELRLLDRHGKTFALHNWRERQPWVMASEARHAKARKAASVRWKNRGTSTDTTVSTDFGSDAQSNAPSIHDGCSEHALSNAPNLTQPNHTQPKNGALFEDGKEAASERRKKQDPLEHWFTNRLLPAFPREGRCQQLAAQRYLRKAKPSADQLADYLNQVEQWKPNWAESGKYPGLHSFLTEGKYRGVPLASSTGNRTDKAPAAMPPTADEYYSPGRGDEPHR